jgi:hypothetical protein
VGVNDKALKQDADQTGIAKVSLLKEHANSTKPIASKM